MKIAVSESGIRDSGILTSTVGMPKGSKKSRTSKRVQKKPGRQGNDFLKTTKRILAQRVNYLCSNPRCRCPTSGPVKRPGSTVSIGTAAHITAAASEGPRYNQKLTPAQRRSVRNGIWMCRNHGTLVDHDKHRYTVAQLRRWKAEAERRAQQDLESGRSRNAPSRLRPPVSQPRLVYAQHKGSPTYSAAVGYKFFVLQVWFHNEPRDGVTPALSLRAMLSFVQQGQPLFSPVHSEWAIANAADNLGYNGTVETWDQLLPNGDYAKLMVLQKREEEADAYAWSKGAPAYPGRRHPSHRIPPGQYELHVRVRGIKIDVTFKYRLVNPGAGGNPTLEPI